MAKPIYNSRVADKFVCRFPDGMRETVEGLAADQHTSMNTFIVQAVEEKIARGVRQELLLDSLEKTVARGNAYVQWLADGNTPISFDQWQAENA